MNLIIEPNFNIPIPISMIPAIKVAIISPVMPNCCKTDEETRISAPVGPLTCNLHPPKRDAKTPATIAEIKPTSGDTPVPIPKAIANGNAITPTIKPAFKSDLKAGLL